MKRLKNASRIVAVLFFVLFFNACDLYTYVTPPTQVTYENPSWAPPYYPGVRYYYLPDIETYYDLTSQQFVYLDNGQWSYSRYLPSIYAGYDLNDCFTVAIDYNTYQPWLHYQYYVSHYPRYYYRDYYDHSNIPYVRGFNENSRSAIYWSEKERNRARRWDNENAKNNHQFKYSESDRRQQNNTNLNNGATRTPDMNNDTRRKPDNRITRPQQPNREDNRIAKPQQPDREENNTIRQQPDNTNNKPQQPNRGDNNTPNQQPDRRDNNTTPPANRGNDNSNRRTENEKNSVVTPPRISGFESGSRQQKEIAPVRTPQNTNYYGRTIGNPVKVEKQMRKPETEKTQNTNRRESTDQKENERR